MYDIMTFVMDRTIVLYNTVHVENLRNNLLVDDVLENVVDKSLIAMQMYKLNTNIQRFSCVVLYYILMEGRDRLLVSSMIQF